MNPDVKTEVISSGPDLSVLGLFFQADPFVKGVMFLLIFASIWCWAIIINKYFLIRKEKKKSMEFEDIFWSGVNLEDLYQQYSENINNSQVRVFISGMREFNKVGQRQTLSSTKLKEVFQRINNSMHISINREIQRLETGMSFLASIGSVAPFIGLLGTVWGIVNAFQSIAISNNTSLAVVAPGIAEALFATALGLLAAIPAVAAYNKFSNDLEKLSNNLEYFSIEFSAVLLRQVEDN
jgi:biopolymer transport protein TolQ